MEAWEMDIDLLIVDFGMAVFVFGVFRGRKEDCWCFGSEDCSAFESILVVDYDVDDARS